MFGPSHIVVIQVLGLKGLEVICDGICVIDGRPGDVGIGRKC